MKTLQYLRVIDSFGFLVQMIISVFGDLVPFTVILILFIFFFSLMVFVMGGTFDDGDYEGIGFEYLYLFIQIFRNSIGDIAEPKYGIWGDERLNDEI
jgi:hypothetical protein